MKMTKHRNALLCALLFSGTSVISGVATATNAEIDIYNHCTSLERVYITVSIAAITRGCSLTGDVPVLVENRKQVFVSTGHPFSYSSKCDYDFRDNQHHLFLPLNVAFQKHPGAVKAIVHLCPGTQQEELTYQ